MITLKKLRLSNFLSHSETTVEFDATTRLSIDGVSGAGKSSLVDAIIWNLYGEGRVDNRALISAGAASGRVELWLNDGERTYVITRTTTKAGKHTLTACEEGTDGSIREVRAGTKQTQEWIVKELIHASYELFINSVAYPQDNSDTFVKQTAAKRKDLLLEIASVEDFEMYYERAKDKLRSTEEAIQRLVGELAGQIAWGNEAEIKATLEKHRFDQTSFEMEAKDIEVRLTAARNSHAEASSMAKVEQEKIAAASRELAQTSAILVTINNEINSKDARVQALETQLKDRPTGTISALMDEVALADQAIQEMTLAANAYSIEKEKLNSLIRSAPQANGLEVELVKTKQQLADTIASFHNLCTLGDSCLNHKTTLESRTKFIEDRIKEIETKIVEHEVKVKEHAEAVRLATAALPVEPSREALSTVVTHKASLNAQIKAINSFEAAEKELSQTLVSLGEKRVAKAEKEALAVSLNAQLAGLGETVKAFNLEALATKVRELDLAYRAMNEKVTAATAAIASQELLLEKIAASAKRQHEIELETIKLNRDKEALELVKDAFSSKGIKAVAVDVLIPQLEAAVNDVLSQLSDFRVTLETQKSSVDGETQIEGLFINVHNPQGQSMEYGAFSGGEKVKVTVAIAEALAGLQKVGFRLLDEAIVGLDEESVLSFTQAMTKIQTKFPQMLVISHIPQIKELFENRIEVIKRDGVSMIA